MKHINIVFIALLFALFSSTEARAQQVAVKVNGLMCAAFTPNIGCEVVIADNSSVDLSVFGHYKPFGIHSSILGIQPEYRYWFNGRPMIREYVGATMLYSSYDMTFSKQVFDGDGLGFGLTGGYVFSFGKRWNLELSGGFGFFFFHQKQYYKGDNYDDYFVDEAVKANSWGYELVPIKLGVTISYIIK